MAVLEIKKECSALLFHFSEDINPLPSVVFDCKFFRSPPLQISHYSPKEYS